MSALDPSTTQTTSASEATGATGGLPAPLLLCALFLVALLPMTAWYLVHHPDERHYTDAGIAMVHTGDWLTPRRPDGSLRFNKPILPYWWVSASYALLGISPFASRLPFLLAGCASVWMTYRLGKLVGGNEAAGRWAALVAVGNLQIVLASTRSIPDILLCLFTTISVYGVLSVLVYDRRDWKSYAAMYIGLALAISSKGLPAIIVVGAVALSAILYRPNRRTDWQSVLERLTNTRKLLHWPTLMIGILLAGGWFVTVYAVHGNAALNEFAHDQVGIRFEVSPLSQLVRAGLFFLWCAAVGLPWIVPLVVSRLRGRFTLGESRQRIAIVSMASGIVALAIAASFCNVVSTRYIVPVVPLCAVWLGSMLAVIQRQIVERIVRWLLLGFSLLLCVIAVALVAANLQTSHPWLAAGCALAFATLVIGIWARNMTFGTATRRTTHAVVDFGLVKLATFPAICLGLFAFLVPDEGETIVGRFHQVKPPPQPVQLIGKPALAGKMRVFDRGQISLSSIETIDAGYTPHCDMLFIADDAAMERLNLQGYQISDFPSGIGRLKERDLLRALCRGELGRYLNEHQKRCYLAVRKRMTRTADSAAAQSSGNRDVSVR